MKHVVECLVLEIVLEEYLRQEFARSACLSDFGKKILSWAEYSNQVLADILNDGLVRHVENVYEYVTYLVEC